MKLEVIDGKQTNWGGLWYHPDTYSFSSQAISLAELRKFKGNVTLVVRKNRFYNNGENGRPNYVFLLRDAKTNKAIEMTVEDGGLPYKDRNGDYFDENGERLYTYDEVYSMLSEAIYDAQTLSPDDVLPKHYI